jgi:hypothetical protein
MFLHPSVHLELARQRHQDLLAAAERRRIAKASADRKAVRGLRAGKSNEPAVPGEAELVAWQR